MASLLLLTLVTQCNVERTYYVALTGDDSSGDGTANNPWRTLSHAVSMVEPNRGHTIRLSEGMFVLDKYVSVPPGVNIQGAGVSATMLRPDSALFLQSSEWLFDRFLITLLGSHDDNIRQTLRDFSIDGANKNLYGAILVKDRARVALTNLDIRDTYFTGIWLWGTKDCHVSHVQLTNCAWGSTQGCSATLQFTASERLEIDHLNIRENIGYGMKGVGDGNMFQLKIHNNLINVNPEGKWRTPEGHVVPNISLELFNVDLRECEIYRNKFNANVSIVMEKQMWTQPSDYQTVHFFENEIDFITTPGASGHGLELTVHNAEIDHNYFYGGSSSIVNWDVSADAHTMRNWKIHHNIFYNLSSIYPSAVINFFRHGIDNVHIYHNTVELSDTSTINLVEVNNGGIANNVKVENNLVINSSTDFQWYPNKVMSVVNDGMFKNSIVRNNSFFRMQIDSVRGVKFVNNTLDDPKITRTGSRPKQYYRLSSESPLIDKGAMVSKQYSGSAPDIGAFESEQD